MNAGSFKGIELSYLMATGGSAFAFHWGHSGVKDHLPYWFFEVVDPTASLAEDASATFGGFKSFRYSFDFPFAADIDNPKPTEFLNAGIDFNLPIPPFLPLWSTVEADHFQSSIDRKVDIVLILELSFSASLRNIIQQTSSLEKIKTLFKEVIDEIQTIRSSIPFSIISIDRFAQLRHTLAVHYKPLRLSVEEWDQERDAFRPSL